MNERKTVRERVPGTDGDTITVVRTRVGHVSIYYTAYNGEVRHETLRTFEARQRRDRFVQTLLNKLNDNYHAPGCNTLSRGCVPGCSNYDKEFDG